MGMKCKISKQPSGRRTRLKVYVKSLHSLSPEDQLECMEELIPNLESVAPPIHTYHPFVKHPDYKGICGLNDIGSMWFALGEQPYDHPLTNRVFDLRHKSYKMTPWRPWDPFLKLYGAYKFIKGDYS